MVSRWWDPGIGERDRIGVGSHHDKDQGVFNGGNPSKLGDLDWKLGKGSFMIRVGLAQREIGFPSHPSL